MSDSRQVQRNITDFWSLIAPGYEAHGGNVPSSAAESDAWITLFRDLLPGRDLAVLDIGTGTGFVAAILAGLGHHAIGIDLSEPMLLEAKGRHLPPDAKVSFERGDGVDPDFPDGRFDAITCRHFLWTLRDPMVALTNWRRLLKPGGRVIAVDGFWFRDQPDGNLEPGPFNDHYTTETRAALPFMHLDSSEPIVRCFLDCGYREVRVDQLYDVHAAASHPPSDEPWYLIVATR